MTTRHEMIRTEESYHRPVLLAESVDGLDIQPAGIYMDMTFGGGGHSREIMRRLGPDGRLFGFDQDADAEANTIDDARFTFVRSNFRYVANWARYYDLDHVDGIIADLGVSSHHFDDATRGFSFRYDAPLDMRMNNRAGASAADLLASYTEQQIADLLYVYGEIRQARPLARAIVKARSQQPIQTTADLCRALGDRYWQQDPDSGLWQAPATAKKELARLFQALRIEVNHEMDALAEMLSGAARVLRPGGRLAVITYHSLEDRMVKNVMKTGRLDGKAEQDFFGRTSSTFRPVGNKPVTPSAAEQQINPRSRSAKLRVAERTTL